MAENVKCSYVSFIGSHYTAYPISCPKKLPSVAQSQLFLCQTGGAEGICIVAHVFPGLCAVEEKVYKEGTQGLKG